MGAEEVVAKILGDARSEAEKLQQQAAEKEAAEQSRVDKELREYREQTEALSRKAGEDKRLHILAAARMDIAREFLSEKRKVLDEVFSQARERIENLPDDEYRKLMGKLMTEAVETGDEEVIVDEQERRIDQEFIKQINRELGAGYRGNLRLSGQRQKLGGGFILRRGRITNNVSIEVLLQQARKELEIELAKELFEDNTIDDGGR